MEDKSELGTPESELLSVRAISELLDRPLRSTYRWLHRSQALPIQRVGRRIFVSRLDAEKLVKQKVAPSSAEPAPPSAAATDTVPQDSGGGVEETVVAQEPTRPEAAMSTKGRSGQRELVLPRMDLPRIAFFSGFDFML